MTRNITKYLVTTFLISWSCFGLVILLQVLGICKYPDLISGILSLVGSLGPTIAAILQLHKKINIKNIKNFWFNRKKKTIHYLLIFCILVLIQYLLLSRYDKTFSPLLVLPLYIYAISFGGGFEEFGWRGILQPKLEEKISFPLATIITGLIWSIWHFPLFFIQDRGPLIGIFTFTLSSIYMSFILASIYKKTNSIFYCSLFHGLINTLSTIFIFKDIFTINNYYIITSLIILIVSITLYYKDLIFVRETLIRKNNNHRF